MIQKYINKNNQFIMKKPVTSKKIIIKHMYIMCHKIGSSKGLSLSPPKNIKNQCAQDGRLYDGELTDDFGDAAYFNHGLRLSGNL